MFKKRLSLGWATAIIHCLLCVREACRLIVSTAPLWPNTSCCCPPFPKNTARRHVSHTYVYIHIRTSLLTSSFSSALLSSLSSFLSLVPQASTNSPLSPRDALYLCLFISLPGIHVGKIVTHEVFICMLILVLRTLG